MLYILFRSVARNLTCKKEPCVAIFQICLQQGIWLDMEWIPRSKNDIADYISRIVDFDDWQVSTDIFHRIDALWGPYAVDRFASDANA